MTGGPAGNGTHPFVPSGGGETYQRERGGRGRSDGLGLPPRRNRGGVCDPGRTWSRLSG
jgi:hypothetical protein